VNVLSHKANIESKQSITEICFDCGFNNISKSTGSLKNIRIVLPQNFEAVLAGSKVFIDYDY
jgi:hypothetical protein